VKSFKNKNALTLIELTISITIWTIILIIVSFFIATSIRDLENSILETNSIDRSFSFKDEINRFIKWWYNDFILYWTWTNKAILLRNTEIDEGVLFWVVNNETKKIQNEYIYWENYLWYRKISDIELADIDTNSWAIYDFTFLWDKIYSGIRIKDFKPELFNAWEILSLYVSIVVLADSNNIWNNFNDFTIDSLDIIEYTLHF
jgi:hypothetical protein